MNERVRRTDLFLRAKYPHLNTRIFKLPNGYYGIFLNDFTGNFDELQKEFDYAIKPVTTPVTLMLNIPSNKIEELPCITDEEIGNNLSGLPLTLTDLEYLLMAKFPAMDFFHIETYDRESKLNIYIDKTTDEELRKKVLEFLYSLDIPLEYYFIENKTEGLAKEAQENEKKKELFSKLSNNNPVARVVLDSFDDPIMGSLPTKLNKVKNRYEERDEQVWFDRLGDIYTGKFTKKEIMNGITSNNSCYIDYAIFNNVNIRNGLVLHDRVFVEPPIETDIKTFCSSQKIKTDEIIQLCKENKLAFILPQPSIRYDYDFFNELFEINPNCILSKRALSALIISDLVEINNNYFVNTLGISDSIYEITEILKEIDGKYSKTDFYNIFMWPQKALRTVLQVFLFGSTYKVAVFGINTIFTDIINDDQKNEKEFEFVMNTDKVHISSALNSQYFPYFEGAKYSNQKVTSIMGNMLNLYKNSSIEKLYDYITERQELFTKQPILPVSLIEVNEYISVKELNDLSRYFFSSDNFNSIIGYLLSLSNEEMDKKIIEYNNLVQKKLNKEKNISTFIDLSVSPGIDVVGLFVPIVGIASAGVKLVDTIRKKTGLTKTKKIEKIREAFFKIGQKYDEKKAISFLTKINSVARLKRNFE